MSVPESRLDGLVPSNLKVRSARILLDSLEVQADIGFHEFEVGSPQRLIISVEIWLEDLLPPPDDAPERAWNYDFLRSEVQALAAERRYNLQETLANRIFERVSAMRRVKAVRIRTSKPDVYPEASGVGVEIASFDGAWPTT